MRLVLLVLAGCAVQDAPAATPIVPPHQLRKGGGACCDDLDCQLTGVCQSAVCQRDAGWTGWPTVRRSPSVAHARWPAQRASVPLGGIYSEGFQKFP